MADFGLGPFPLQTNLRRLKPNLGRLLPVIAGGAVFLGSDDLLRLAEKFLGTTEGMVVAGLLVAVILFMLADLYLKKIYFNERGIGIINPMRGDRTWYSFDELKDGKFSLRKTKARAGNRMMLPTGTMVLHFHTGTVRLWPSLYDNKSMAEFSGILSRRFPDQYRPIPVKLSDDAMKTKEKMERSRRREERARIRKETQSQSQNSPGMPPLGPPGSKKKLPWQR